MNIESSHGIVKSQIATLLVAYHMAPDGEEYALDLIEFIALRMKDHEDVHVAELGIFVRVNLMNLKAGRLAFADVLPRFATAAIYAPLGHAEISETFRIGTAL